MVEVFFEGDDKEGRTGCQLAVVAMSVSLLLRHRSGLSGSGGCIPSLSPRPGVYRSPPRPDEVSLAFSACRLDLVASMLFPKMVKAVHKVCSVSTGAVPSSTP